MKTKLILILALLTSYCLQSQTLGPELVSSSGAYKDTLSISLSWSVGEPVTENFSRDENILSQGFHNGKYTVTTLTKQLDLDYEIKVFPNPAKDLINIQFPRISDNTGKEFRLFDLKGNLLKTGRINNTPETLDFSNFPAAIYLLQITENNRILQSFKIQKVN